MLSNGYAELYWTVNAEPFFGYDAGKLLIVGHRAGGGFAGSPEELEIGLANGITPNQPVPLCSRFPQPSSSVQYHIGGRMFNGYHCCDLRRLEVLRKALT